MLTIDPSTDTDQIWRTNCLNALQEQQDQLISTLTQSHPTLYAALTTTLNIPGKRWRPLLVYATGDMLGVPLSQLHAPALAIELIHTYSLVHDDLPAMDNADTRRGQPSCHITHGEAMAILTGDALLTMAFDRLSRDHMLTPLQKVNMMASLAQAAGPCGMIDGQVRDINPSDTLRREEITVMHLKKTGALILACVEMPQAAADSTSSKHNKLLKDFATHLGLAYQLFDDLSDREEDALTHTPHHTTHTVDLNTLAWSHHSLAVNTLNQLPQSHRLQETIEWLTTAINPSGRQTSCHTTY